MGAWGPKVTANQLGDGLMERIAERMVEAKEATNHEAARDLALAKTHLEDALTRYNSACYRLNGTWKRADPDA